MDRRQSLGAEGEQLAQAYLSGLGLKVLAKNFRCRQGELDLVLADRGQIVFVEVRTKSSLSFGSGLESITAKKRTKLRQVAQHYLAANRLLDADVRFDIVAIYKLPSGKAQIEHVKGAF